MDNIMLHHHRLINLLSLSLMICSNSLTNNRLIPRYKIQILMGFLNNTSNLNNHTSNNLIFNTLSLITRIMIQAMDFNNSAHKLTRMTMKI